MHNSSPRILINQIKNIGDVVFCLPTAGLIKKYYPDAKISLLALEYTHRIAQLCPHIDELLSWDQLAKQNEKDAVSFIKDHHFHVVIHLANNQTIAKLAYKAGIPIRIGTAQRIYHWRYCNRRINQARRNSRLNELQLNAQLLTPLAINEYKEREPLLSYMTMLAPKLENQTVAHLIKPAQFNLIVHPGSHGHGREWPEAHFIALIHQLTQAHVNVFITGTDKEALRFQKLIQACPKAHNLMGKLSLDELVAFIANADGLIASGTGPLHIAAALGKFTLGLFPPRKGISPRRWRPPGKKVEVLMHDKRKGFCFSCRESADCVCMAKIKVDMVVAVLKDFIKEKQLTKA